VRTLGGHLLIALASRTEALTEDSLRSSADPVRGVLKAEASGVIAKRSERKRPHRETREHRAESEGRVFAVTVADIFWFALFL